jgi:hypothetical protein
MSRHDPQAVVRFVAGANTVIFSIVNGLLSRPLPFPQPEALVGVWHVAPGFVSFPLNQAAFTYFTYRDEATSFEDIGLWTNSRASVISRGDPEDLPAKIVQCGEPAFARALLGELRRGERFGVALSLRARSLRCAKAVLPKLRSSEGGPLSWFSLLHHRPWSLVVSLQFATEPDARRCETT